MTPARNKVEIMAPVGSYESLMAAIKAGADSVYFGVHKLNMRSHSANFFKIKDIKKIAGICRKRKVKSYLALNSVICEKDLELMKKICDAAKTAGITSIIASDMAVISYASSIKLKIHTSVQLNVSNIDAVKYYSEFADVIVLARELSLKEVKEICDKVKKQKIKGQGKELIKIELFIHGALCVSITGKCYMSLAAYNSSANQGACLQNCRRSYKVIDEETGDELRIDNKYIMSPKDLCTIKFIDKILESGASVLKIEGRGRSPDYVYTVTKTYREAVDSYYAGTYTKDKIRRWANQLSSVYNRGFWHGGYYLGKKLGEWSRSYGSKAAKQKIFLGIAKNFFSRKKIAEFLLQSGKLKEKDNILITGPTTGVVYAKAESIYHNNKPVTLAKKGDYITIPINEKVRKNDKLYIIKDIH